MPDDSKYLSLWPFFPLFAIVNISRGLTVIFYISRHVVDAAIYIASAINRIIVMIIYFILE